jgi:hypothetical protein
VAWGYNRFGQCDVPAPNADFVAVAGGMYHSLGLTGYTWYVDQVNTSGPWLGTSSYPFQHVADANAAATSGDRIIVRTGVYPENVTFSKWVRVESAGGLVRIGTP